MTMQRTIPAVGVIMLLTALRLIPIAAADASNDKDARSEASTQAQLGRAPSPPASEQDVGKLSIETELQEVKRVLKAQQQRIEALESELKKARESGAALPATTANTNQKDVAEGPEGHEGSEEKRAPDGGEGAGFEARVQALETKLKSIGPFSFSGDFRLRDEPFFGGPADRSLDRNRERYRLRFNVNAKLNDEFSGGFSLATGDLNDPISTNQTSNQFYTRKPFALDRAFINYNPHRLKQLTLTGGKFSYPWYNTELTWDKDLNPEGLAQTLAFNLESVRVLKRIALVGFELPFTEVAGTSLTNKSVVTSAAYGGQLQTVWSLAPWIKLSAYTGYYNLHNADPIAAALAKASLRNPTTPLVGLLPLAASGNTVQNSVVTTTGNGVVTVAGQRISTGVSTIANAQFLSRFGLLDSIARLDIVTAHQRWPVTIVGDYVQNTRACANAAGILALPANSATATFSQSVNVPCNSRERRGYWAELRYGRAQEKGDWQFAYTRIFLEREAVLSVFDYSELRQGSNVTEHRAEVLYQLHRNIQLNFIGLFGRPLNFGSTRPPEPFLSRLQFDAIYRF